MSGAPPPDARPDAQRSLERDVDRFERRERTGAAFWRSLSLVGSVGWSIALPSAAGAWLGHRLDLRFGTGVRFTLMLLFVGVMLGGAVAWHVLRNHRK